MGDLIDTGEMYLKTVYELEEEGITPLRARIAERLGHSGPTVSETVARLNRDGLLNVGASRHLELTVAGRRKATDVMRKHRLAERLLTDVLLMEWPYVHEEACRWEHVMSDRVAERMAAVLGDITVDPYGNPIPTEIEGPAALAAPFSHLVSLEARMSDLETCEAVLVRIAEPLQVDVELLVSFQNAGIKPGVTLSVTKTDGDLELRVGENDVVTIPLDMARHLFIEE